MGGSGGGARELSVVVHLARHPRITDLFHHTRHRRPHQSSMRVVSIQVTQPSRDSGVEQAGSVRPSSVGVAEDW